jgi:hypothetical protein
MKSQGAKQGTAAVKSKQAAGGHPAGEHLEAGPHGDAGHTPEHVTKTHPGETSPHPATGVHAVHVHHVGGKHEPEAHGSGSQGHQFMTHTHHADGSVETTHHADMNAVHDHMTQMFPTSEGNDSQHDQNADSDSYGGGGSLANMMSSMGGE